MRRIIISGLLAYLLAMFPNIMLAQTLVGFEYWFDGDIAGRQSRSLSGTTGDINESIDVGQLSAGVHSISMRIKQSDETYSAITTSLFVKNFVGVANKLEYWIDDEISSVRTIDGSHGAGNSYIFVDDLDLGAVTPGHHRLYCRAVSSNNLVSSAVSMTPIIVKSRYANNDDESYTLRHYSISVDNEAPMVHDVLNPKEEFNYSGSLDARYLSPGQHMLKTKFWNSMGMSVSAEHPFTVNVQSPGEITLTATDQDGVVRLEYNNVPNNLKHNVLRSNNDNTWYALRRVNESCDVNVVNHYTDIPSAAGIYSYKIKGVYEKYDGSIDTVASNVVTVNVAKTQDELTNYGYIIGQVPDMYPLFKHAYFSDGEHVSFTGTHFSREMIPVGTELTIEVMESSDSETFYQPVTLTVQAGENVVNFEPLTGADRPYYDQHHLEFASDLEWTGLDFKFDVKCHTSQPWTGRVRLRAISKKDAEHNDGNNGNGGISPGGDAGTQAGAVAPMPNVSVEKNYYYAYSDSISLYPNKTASVTLSLDNLFPDKKKEYYLFYIESEGQWRDGVESMDEIRPVAINHAYNVTDYPIVHLIDKSQLEQDKDEIALQDAEYAANLILMVAGYIKSFDGILGKTMDFCDFMKDVSLTKYGISEREYNNMIESAMNAETWDDLLNSELVKEAPVTVLADLGTGLIQTLREDVLHDIIKYGKGVKQYLGKAMSVLKYIKQYKEWEQLNTYERSFYCLNAILDAYEKSNPFAVLVKPYVEVGKSMIAKALEYGEAYNAGYEATDLYHNEIEFKIKVQTNRLVDFNFAWHGISQIREVKVMAANRDDWDKTMVDTIFFEPEGVNDGVMLRQTRYSGIDPMTGGGNLEFGKPLQRLWMEIKWKNGRTSKIPLVGKNNEIGVNYSVLLRRYTIHFKSETTKYENIADIIHLTDNKTL